MLNDTVGNFVNRTLSLTEEWFDNEVPVGNLRPEDEETIEEAEEIIEEYVEAFEDHEIKEALDKSLQLARLGDRYLSEEEPWNNEDIREETIHVAVQIIRSLAVTLYPFTPETTEKIEDMLNADIHTSEGVDELMDPMLGGLEPGHKLGERELLFEKIDTSDKQGEEEMEHEFNEDTVSFDDFQDMDIRTGEVEEVEEHPNADKLYKVQ
ncbi:MAG: class I tRNA ligase family protein, partial [Candidatus Nanohalobium sp.]